MIHFKPENLNENTVKITAVENDISCGYCLMKTSANFADVYEISFDEDKPYLVEGILRSAYNFASLKNIYMGKCSCKNIDSFLKRMNFDYINNEYINDIPSILMGSCCK